MNHHASRYTYYTYVTVKEGKIEEFNRLVEEICKAVEDNEPGAKRYQFFLNDDKTQ